MKRNRQIPATTWLTSRLLRPEHYFQRRVFYGDGVLYCDYIMRAQSVIMNGDVDPPGR